MSRPAATAKHRARTRWLIEHARRLGVRVELGTSRRYGGFATYTFHIRDDAPPRLCHGIKAAELYLDGLRDGRNAELWADPELVA